MTNILLESILKDIEMLKPFLNRLDDVELNNGYHQQAESPLGEIFVCIRRRILICFDVDPQACYPLPLQLSSLTYCVPRFSVFHQLFVFNKFQHIVGGGIFCYFQF